MTTTVIAGVEWNDGPGEESDPRRSGYVRAGDIVIDQRVQRPVSEARIRELAENWDWSLAEALTVVIRDGQVVTPEGQNRVLALQRRDPDAKMLCVLVEEDSTAAREAVIASGIATGRRAHTPLQLWRLDAVEGNEHVRAAEDVLVTLGLRIGDKTTEHTISAVKKVRWITSAEGRSPDEGAALLLDTLGLVSGIPDVPRQEGKHFDGMLLISVAHILLDFRDILDMNRLITKLSGRSSQNWLVNKARPLPGVPAWHGVYNAIIDDYNHSKRQLRLESTRRQ